MDTAFDQLQSALKGRYSLERELGRGGMGVVYLARDVALDRPVAIKLLPAELAASADARERFLREARTAAQLSHPNIIPIHLVEEHDGAVFFVMAFVEGESLGQRVQRAGPLPPAEVVRVVREVAWALGYAHGRNVIHRDVKPDNILLDRDSGRAMVADFGIARVTSRSTMSQEGEILGTAQFMAPEQADPSAVLDGRSDLYALGATAFYALTGRVPFEAPHVTALLAMVLTEPAPPIATVRPGVPPRLAEAVDRCLAKEPAARFANAEAMAEALGDAVAVVRPIPPSVLALRDAVNGGALYGSIMAMTYMLAREGWPESARPVGAAALLLVGMAAFQVFVSARTVVLAGFSTVEVKERLRQLVMASDASTEFNTAQVRLIGRFFAKPIGRVLLVLLGVLEGGVGLEGLISILRHHPRGVDQVFSVLASLVFVAVGVGILFVAWKPRLIGRPEHRGDPDDWRTNLRLKFWDLVWDNPITRVLFIVAGIGVRRPKAVAVASAAPTEVLLGKAADDVFAALPSGVRDRLAEVPAVIRRLERAAQSLRARRDEIDRSIGEAGQVAGRGANDRGAGIVRELERARVGAAARLATAMTALENLRLDLLRLRAGVGKTGDLTGSLEEARRIGEAVDAELEGRDEVERLTAG